MGGVTPLRTPLFHAKPPVVVSLNVFREDRLAAAAPAAHRMEGTKVMNPGSPRHACMQT